MSKDLTAFLTGRKFVSSSGNVCRVSRLENNALRLNWGLYPASPCDMQEGEDWVISLVEAQSGGNVHKTVCDDESQEASLLSEWRAQGGAR